jgi:predicted nuclease with TOPRIM domain
MSTSDLNGTAPPPVDALAGIIEQLEEQLAPIAAERSQLEAQVAELLKREHRIKAGITALRTGAPKAPSPTTTKRTDARNKHDWQPSQKVIDDVYAVFATSEEPLTLSKASDLAHNSRGTVAKAIDVLRSEERLRLIGTASSQGSPKLYTVLPW